jgi:hypothetical protein
MLVFLYMAALFAVMSPGVFVRFPKNCSKLVVAATHGAAFVFVFWLTHKFVMRLGRRMGYEGFQGPSPTPMPPSVPMPLPPSAPMTAPPSAPMPMPAQPIQYPGGSPNLAAMNVMLSVGPGQSGNPCKNGNDCSSGMCMSSKCM